MTSTPTTPAQLLEALNWRYATKVFDPARKIPAATWQSLERALVLSPSSYGLQPYRVIEVEDAAKRSALVPHSWGQRQVVDASHYLVFTAKTTITARDIDQFITLVATKRGLQPSALEAYKGMMLGDLVNGPRQAIVAEWAARQAYIALGNLLTSSALLGVDTCPMEGFVPAEYDRILGLAGSGYGAVVACALGYRSAQDKYATLAKVRFEAAELVKKV
jgi:nitroreductase